MKTYLLNDLNMNGFDNLVTLLDCEIRINDELNSIHFPIGKKRKVLVDALLYLLILRKTNYVKRKRSYYIVLLLQVLLLQDLV